MLDEKRGKDEAGGRHRDGHRLVHRQQHAGSAGVVARSQIRHRARRQICRTRFPLPGTRRADARSERSRRSPRHALSRRRRRLEPCRHGTGDPRFRSRGNRYLERAHRPHHGLGRAIDPHHRRERRHRAQQGPEARRPVRGAEGDVVDRVGDAVDLVQDQGRQLFDLVGLRDIEPLHRQCLRDHPGRQAGHDLRRRLRGTRLDAVGAVRRHGRDVVELQSDAGQSLARLRCRSRRLRHRRRRRRAGARRARTCQGAWRENLRRGRWLWRDLRRRRHGGALRRRRHALHENGARRR